MIRRLYAWLHRLTSPESERGEYSGGYWQYKVRRAALLACRGFSGRLLEVGCGEGLYVAALARQDPQLEIFGVDLDRSLLAKARERVAAGRYERITLSQQDGSGLAFGDGYFDAVVCINVLYNIPTFEAAARIVSQMKRVCKPGGRLLFDFRNARNALLRAQYRFARYYDRTLRDLPLNAYDPEEIEALMRDLDLAVIQERHIGFPGNRYAPIILIEAKKQ